jgi:ATP-dependent HslUV protease ATP-binding subunit HslU
VREAVEERILTALLGPYADPKDVENYRKLVRERDPNIENTEIEIDMPSKPKRNQYDINPQLEEIYANIEIPGLKMRPERRKSKISDARSILEDQEIEKIIRDRDINKEAIIAVEQSGIVFIDEIDKIISSGDHRSADASAEGVQRDLLPLIEGTTISTKHGNVNTDFILFIASGAFHSKKPSDLLAELQGRLPIRVSLKALTEEDFYRILTEPVTNLLKQQVELMKAENVELVFTEDAIKEVARVAYMVRSRS